jgi:RNA polymerase sigma-70 factor (ECF subfamily)
MQATPLQAIVPDDETLVARICAGDEQAFATLYRRYARYLAGVAYRLMPEAAELDDVVQETFTIAFRTMNSVRDPAYVKWWLVAITVRNVTARIRGRQRWQWLKPDVEVMAPRVSDPRHLDRVHSLYQSLSKLSAKLRIPWMLHHIEGYSLPVVAEVCDMSLATVKRRISEAARRLEGASDGR